MFIKEETRISLFSVYALAVFTEYKRGPPMGECQEVLWRFAFSYRNANEVLNMYIW